MYKQIIIARKDLNMSAGKLAAQVSHASMAFLSWMIRDNAIVNGKYGIYNYYVSFKMDRDLYEQWLNGEFTKVVLQAKNKAQLMKVVELANNLGLKEKEDFFVIKDNCHTELEPEEDGRTLTCIGFKPMDSEIIDQIGEKYHMYIG